MQKTLPHRRKARRLQICQLVVWVVGAGKMGKQAFRQKNGFFAKIRNRACRMGNFRRAPRRKTDPVHAGVQRVFYPQPNARRLCRAAKRPGVFARKKRLRKVKFGKQRGQIGVCIPQNQNACLFADRFAQSNSLLRAGNRKPAAPLRKKRGGASRHSVTVGVGFDHGDRFGFPLQAAAKRPVILPQREKVDLGPGTRALRHGQIFIRARRGVHTDISFIVSYSVSVCNGFGE